MVRTLNIETLIEDAFIASLALFIDSDVPIKSWDDGKYTDLSPMIRVKATLAEELAGTMNTYSATNVIVDFGVFTSKKRDEDGRIGNSIRGDIRDLLNQGDIEDVLNTAIEGLHVYDNGIIPQSSGDVPDKKLFQKTITILVVATTI